MACPYFYPVERFDDDWVKPPRVPLGDPCRGLCRAVSDQPFQPDDNQQQCVCNHGYARERCDRFPSAAEADAVRFSIESDDDARVEIVYVLEKDWGPVRFGRTECAHDGRVDDEQLDPLLKRQIEFFALSYLARRWKTTPGISHSAAARSSIR